MAALPTDTKATQFTVPDDAAGMKLADLLAAQIDSQLARVVLAQGGVWVGRHRVQDAACVVPAGSTITVHYPPGGRYATLHIAPEDIIYEDRWLIVLHKRSGWYVVPTPWDAYGNVRVALAQFLQARDGKPPTLHLVHQLDRDTSGVLLCTRDRAANGPLQEAFDAEEVQKEYRCLCVGEPPHDVFEVRSGHGRGRKGLWRLYELDEVGAVLPNGSQVKLAASSFRIEQRLSDAALLRAQLHTGRTHQIRLHLASLGHPLLGDVRYGGPATFRGRKLPGHLLHAAWMRLRHPITYRPLELKADLPEQMRTILEAGG